MRPAILQTATLAELTERVQEFSQVRSMKATVQLQLSFVTEDEQRIKEYTDVRGFILIRRPEDIRILAQLPVVRSTVFDMVADGQTFKVHLPTKRRVLSGDNARDKPSPKRIENVRPQHVREAVLIEPPHADEEPLLYNTTEGLRAYHVLELIRRDEKGAPRLSRKFYFGRIALNLVRQEIYNDQGDIVTSASYADWAPRIPVSFPDMIRIDRPKDGYNLEVRVLEVNLNEPLEPDQFTLKPPPGTKIEVIGQSESEAKGEDSGRG